MDLTDKSQLTIGRGDDRRKPGAAGVLRQLSRTQIDVALVDCVTKVAYNFVVLSDSVVGNTRIEEENVVRNELERAIALLESLFVM